LTLDKGIPAHELAAEANGAVQEPPPKKTLKRKKTKPTNGVEPRPEPEVNGDAMEIEQNGTTHVTNSVRGESETMVSESESLTVAEIPISTLSIGQDVEIQTEVIPITDLAPGTFFVEPHRDPKKVVEHTSWGSIDPPVLLSAGTSLLRVHVVNQESSSDRSLSVQTGDLSLPVDNFKVTALCWNSEDELSLSLREQCFNEVGEKMMMDKLIRLTEGGQSSHVVSSTAGLINTLRWNEERNMLLSISTDGEKGSIKVWRNDSDSIPAWTDFTDTAIFDAHWISDSAFVVCGIKLFKIYEVNDTLTTQRTLDTQVTWEIVKYDPASGIIAVLGIEDKRGYFGILHPNDSINLQTREYPDEYPTDLDFRIKTTTNNLTNGSSIPSVLLATSSMSGGARIWDANEPFKMVKWLGTTDGTQAWKIAFSPDGTLLAAAGPDAVTVWDVEKRDIPVATWHAREFSSDKWNPGTDGEFSLGWHPDSSRLSIAFGNQVRREEYHGHKNTDSALDCDHSGSQVVPGPNCPEIQHASLTNASLEDLPGKPATRGSMLHAPTRPAHCRDVAPRLHDHGER
jgi:transducin (beta)-like 1